MTSSGWMPREMILDAEARSRVPAEFITQHPDVANPPMFFYVIESLMRSTDVRYILNLCYIIAVFF